MKKELSKVNVIWKLVSFQTENRNRPLIQANLLRFLYNLDELKTYCKQYNDLVI